MQLKCTCSFPPGSWFIRITMLLVVFIGLPAILLAQMDQGTVTGVVQDKSGAVVPDATVALTSVDTGLVLSATTDGSGVYTFSPVKIGNYKLSAQAAGFSTAVQDNVHLSIQQRLEVNLQLQPGAASQTVEVTTAPPLLQTQSGSTGQVVDAATINATPLNGRNWVFIAQLTSGVAPSNGARGQGKGDFNANGQRAEQNNFILDGVDNNTNAVDFLNGASFSVRPPPDALAEFKVQTGSYSAEFGHSAGAVVNASIKSGSNQIHGDLWEYWRNNILDARDYFATSVPKYRQNQFGATLGLPVLKDKLFFFGDVEANRILFAAPSASTTVPTPLMRQGNFSELLNPALTGNPAVQLYQPNSADLAQPLSCNGQNNVLCPNQISATARNILNLYPLPNINGGKTFSNYAVQRQITDNTFQWDTRMDWNISQHDQAFARFSYLNEPAFHPAPLGPILDGGGYGDDGNLKNFGENFAGSETHEFNSNLINEFRFGYNYGHFSDTQQTANQNTAAQVGLGGIPFAPLNGGLPATSITGITSFGAPEFYAANEYQNIFQILDNVTKVAGNHTLKAGVNFQRSRFYTLAPTAPRGAYSFSGKFTGVPGVDHTGYGVADFLANQIDTASISNLAGVDQYRWTRAAYFQDDWKALPRLTLNLGLRYEFVTPPIERHDRQAAFEITGPIGPGTGTGVFHLPSSQQSTPLPSSFLNLLAKDNVTVNYSNNRALVDPQYSNIAPRIGMAYTLNDRLVLRGGYGIFFGGAESTGGAPNLGFNFPFQFTSSFNSSDCKTNACPSNGITLENGFTQQINQGLVNAVSSPSLVGSQHNVKTTYSQQFNLALEYAISNNLTASASYVGSNSRHLSVSPDGNASAALIAPTLDANAVRPFPDLGTIYYNLYEGTGNYNSLQTKLERRYASHLSFLATYTYSHSLDDATTPLGSNGDGGYRNVNLIGLFGDYSNSPWDTRHRFTLNASYELPFGSGRRFLNHGGVVNQIVGGWSDTLVFRAQTGQPFTVYNNNSSAKGAGARAILVGDPFKAGGTPNSTNNTIECPTKVRTVANWFNPCAFANPPDGSVITGNEQITGDQALSLLGGRRNNVFGPGYERIDMSIFKSFPVFREQSLQFRADAFNLLNTPAYGTPNNGIGSNGGQITSARNFQPNTPDARFFQLALKYIF